VAAARAYVHGLLGDEAQLDQALEQIWKAAARAFPGDTLEDWLDVCRALRRGVAGQAGALGYLSSAVGCAEIVGAHAAIALGDAAAIVAGLAGTRGMQGLLVVAPRVARRLQRAGSFQVWLDIVARLAELAPESLPALLDRSEGLLAELDPRGLEAWALSGIRAAGGDPERRLAFFTLSDRQARRWLDRESGEVQFSDVERRLKAYLTALWRSRAPIRPAAGKGEGIARRASFGDGLIRVPESFRGVAGGQGAELFRACLAHVGAHLRHTPARFPVGTLKPMQIALVSLIEDARVEQLAMQEMPGLRRLWLPFHVAEPGGAQVAPILMARLARALIDPEYADDDAWVRKGRDAFLAQRDRWHDPAISREIGGLLGNDLGQMRVQFNPRTYVVEPPYRDDNLGLWDFGADQPPPPEEEAEIHYEAVRLEREERDSGDRDRQKEPEQDAEDAPVNRARAAALPDDAGIPVARYPEWDYELGRDRPDWTTILDVPAAPGQGDVVERILEAHEEQVHRITKLIRAAKVSRPARVRRQPEGDRLDLDACIEAAVTHRIGATPDPRVYADVARRHRDLSVLVLLDISQSTNDIVRGDVGSVLALERAATALLAHAMAGLGDPFAIHAFCSNGREEVRYVSIKDFSEPYDGAARARLAGLKGSLSTRIGAAIRHAGRLLERQATHRRLLLIVTDGEPSDVDVADRRYLVEDARKAVALLSHEGIDVFCVGLDAGGDSYLSQIFGRRNVVQIDRLERLPEKLPMLYFRLTA